MSTQTSVSLGRGALAKTAPETPERRPGAARGGGVRAAKSQVEALLRERGRGQGFGGGRPDWQHPGRRATIPSTPPPVEREPTARVAAAAAAGADDVEVGPGGDDDDDADGPAGVGGSTADDDERAPTTRRLARRVVVAGEAAVHGGGTRSGARAETRRGARRGDRGARTARARDAEAQRRPRQVGRRVHARGEGGGGEGRRVEVAERSTQPPSTPPNSTGSTPSATSAEDRREGARGDPREVREEAAANLDALRAMHARECQLRDENLVAANNLTRKVVQDLADSKTARDALESEVRRVNERVKAVEDEFRVGAQRVRGG